MMTKHITSIIGIIILLNVTLFSQVSHGFVKEDLKVPSKILHRDVSYSIYLPFDYETSQRYYPVVYLLHGYTDDDKAWIQFGDANLIADKGISDMEIPPMILVMPDAGLTFYVNNYNDSVRYEDFFFKEFIPYIESHYRILKQKRYRGVAGLSMGGYGALVYALKHPDMFSACAAFSPGIYTDDQIITGEANSWHYLGPVFGPDLKGKARLTKQFYEDDPIYLMQHLNPDTIKTVRYYIDCGDDDFLYKGSSTLHIIMRELDIPHQYRVRNGSHQWSYWRSGLLNGLKFIGESFQPM